MISSTAYGNTNSFNVGYMHQESEQSEMQNEEFEALNSNMEDILVQDSSYARILAAEDVTSHDDHGLRKKRRLNFGGSQSPLDYG